MPVNVNASFSNLLILVAVVIFAIGAFVAYPALVPTLTLVGLAFFAAGHLAV